ncbi:hypothetical protein GCM10023187_05300 [Nibrella viscosa]|uniref:YhhN-like protein n=1 Tax=Nibrella viscosa TaxID=1084524 RepID=A0ABP8JWD8_9BACT
MSGSATLRFAGVYALLTSLEIVGETLPVKLLHYGCKPLLMLSLLVYLYTSRPKEGMTRSLRWIVAGLFFALAGDVFLMIREVDLFAPGLASFLLMQLCYIAAFRISIREGGKVLSLRQVVSKALPFVIYLAVFLYFLYTPLMRNPATASLWVPVVVYVLCISSMGILATLRRGSVPAASYRRVLAGALLFMLSDSLIAINKFMVPVPAGALLVMSTYAAAQYGIVTGMLVSAFAGWQKKSSGLQHFFLNMKPIRNRLPGFKATCILVGVLNIIFAGSMFAQGVIKSMAQFKVPSVVLASPHYEDAMFFVFLHMFMIGALVIMIGILAEDPLKKVWVARALVLMHLVYAYFDIRSSDTYFGNALYQGPSSVVPVYIDLFYVVLFLRLSFAREQQEVVPVTGRRKQKLTRLS